MKYAYAVNIQGRPDSPTHYLNLYLDRVMVSGAFYESHDNRTAPAGTNEFLASLKTIQGVSGDYIYVNGSRLQIVVCPFRIGNTVKLLVKRLQRRFAKGEGRQRITIEEMNRKATDLNITREVQAANVLAEAGRLFPNQDPLRLGSAIKDLNLPPNEALKVLRTLAVEFQGDNGDPIRLIAGYKHILGLVPATT